MLHRFVPQGKGIEMKFLRTRFNLSTKPIHDENIKCISASHVLYQAGFFFVPLKDCVWCV